jgi:hypothetical protein
MSVRSDLKEVVREKYGQAATLVQAGSTSCCGTASSLTSCCDPITSFPAVINPDLYGFSRPGSINTSGQFTGSSLSPDSFSFRELPVYAIVPFAGSVLVDLPSNFSPWNYSVDPYATDGTPQFSLSQVGTLSLVATGGSYHASGAFTPTAPIPEPEQYALMLAGLGLIALVAHRKRRQGISATA